MFRVSILCKIGASLGLISHDRLERGGGGGEFDLAGLWRPCPEAVRTRVKARIHKSPGTPSAHFDNG